MPTEMSRWSHSGFLRSKSQQPAQVQPQAAVHEQGPGCPCHQRVSSPSGSGGAPLCPRRFVERYSLPRLVRVVPQEPTGGDMSVLTGQLLMYSHYKSGKIEARSQTRMRGSSTLVIPDTYQGWFSVVTERGQVKARCYSTLQRLVTSQVTVFLVVNDLTGYTLNNRLNLDGRRQQYSKTIVRGGQVLKLLAVYQDLGSNAPSSSSSAKSKRLSWPLLNRSQAADAGNRYAQCLTSTDQVLYIPLTTPGQFYAVASTNGANPTGLNGDDTVSKVYQLPKLLRTFPLPVRVCIINSCKPQGSMLLETYRKEEVILTCLLDPPVSSGERFRLLEIDVNSKFFVVRPTKRISDERRLFQSDRVQSALRYCHENWEKWSRQLKVIHHIYPKEALQAEKLHQQQKRQQQQQQSAQVSYFGSQPVQTKPTPETKQQQNARHRKISLGDKKTVKSASFRFSTSYQPDDLRPVVVQRPPLPRRPADNDDHIYNNVASDDDGSSTDSVEPPRRTVAASVASSSAQSYRTKISVGDLVDRVFSESGYSYNQELRRPFYRTRLHVGSETASSSSDMPYSAVRDRLHSADNDDDGVYAEIGETNVYRSRYTYIPAKSAASMS